MLQFFPRDNQAISLPKLPSISSFSKLLLLGLSGRPQIRSYGGRNLSGVPGRGQFLFKRKQRPSVSLKPFRDQIHSSKPQKPSCLQMLHLHQNPGGYPQGHRRLWGETDLGRNLGPSTSCLCERDPSAPLFHYLWGEHSRHRSPVREWVAEHGAEKDTFVCAA